MANIWNKIEENVQDGLEPSQIRRACQLSTVLLKENMSRNGMKMEDTAELRHMLMSFRVSELQALLGFAGRSKSGRKPELLGRALQLLKCEENFQIRAKIQGLYRQRFPRRAAIVTQAHQPAPRPVVTNADSAGVPVHPDVRLTPLPFFEELDVLERPTSLVPHGVSQYQEKYLVFHLTPYAVQLIQNSRDTRPNSRNDFTVQIHLRFCLFETSCTQSDNFPSSLCVKVNGKICPVPGFPPSSNVNPNECKRPAKPVNITPLCRLSPTCPNHVHITWSPKFGQRHVVTVRLVKAVTSSCLIQKLKYKGVRNPDHSRALIKEKLAHDPDSEVATTSLRVSLLCPLGKTRMTLPCRAITCNHLQCFDAALYLQMNERKTTWICPVCDQKAPFDKLILDGLYKEILNTVPPNCNEIIFYEDGSWITINEGETESKAAISSIIASPSKERTFSKPIKPDPVQLQPEKKTQKAEVIDLTLDSDSEKEEEEENGDEDISGSIGDARMPTTSGLLTPNLSYGAQRPPLFNNPFSLPPNELQGLDFYQFFQPDDRYNPLFLTDQLDLPSQLRSASSTPGSSSSVINLD